MAARIDDEALPVTKDSVIVLQSAGPQGAPGMPEWGQLPIPKKLLKEGVRDMLRISDARMSGTSYGACVLHVTPESHVGGPFALVRDGDMIELDVDARRIDMLVSDEELARRRAAWKQPAPKFTRGFGVLYLKHIQQADTGCDFDFLETEKAEAPAGRRARNPLTRRDKSARGYRPDIVAAGKNGRLRSRCPDSRKTALARAGASVGTPSSPTPPIGTLRSITEGRGIRVTRTWGIFSLFTVADRFCPFTFST